MSRNHVRLHAGRWAAIRRAVFNRDGWRCTSCGKAGRLEAHHEPPLAKGGDPYDMGGIITLCRDCHIKRHRPDMMTPGRAEWLKAVDELA